jgi:ABC-type polysaccharide/polyol phosphate export permease
MDAAAPEQGMIAQPPPLSPPASSSRAMLAAADLRETMRRWRVWGRIGWQDIRMRYRRSIIGPFWLTLSMAVMVTALGVLYAQLLRITIRDYLPFLTLGLLAWGLISGLLNDGGQAFIGAAAFIRQVRMPHAFHALRSVWRNFLIFAHNIVVFVGVALVFQIWPSPATLLVIPGLVLLLLNGVWATLLLGMICLRFRDAPQIITSLLQVVFFVTPVLWKPELLEGRRYAFVALNPFYHFVELVRAPLLGHAPALETWLATGAIGVLGWAVTFVFFSRYRHRIPYWV